MCTKLGVNIHHPVAHHPCTVFKPAFLTEFYKLILSSLIKSCELDPIPTFLLKSKIINLSLSSGMFPSHFKNADVIPLLKKPSLPANDLNSCKPIYNLSEVLEKVASSRKGRVTALTLLYLSAAFNTINYSLIGMAYRTQHTCVNSFLRNRFQSIKITNLFKGSVFVLRCSPSLYSWTTVVYSVYNATKALLFTAINKTNINMQMTPKYIYLYLQQTVIFHLNS